MKDYKEAYNKLKEIINREHNKDGYPKAFNKITECKIFIEDLEKKWNLKNYYLVTNKLRK